MPFHWCVFGATNEFWCYQASQVSCHEETHGVPKNLMIWPPLQDTQEVDWKSEWWCNQPLLHLASSQKVSGGGLKSLHLTNFLCCKPFLGKCTMRVIFCSTGYLIGWWGRKYGNSYVFLSEWETLESFWEKFGGNWSNWVQSWSEWAQQTPLPCSRIPTASVALIHEWHQH